MRRWQRLAVLPLVALLGLLVVAQIALPRLAATIISAQLASRTKAELVMVEVEAFPAWKLLAGEMDGLHLDLRNARFGDLPTSGFLVDGRGIIVDLRRLFGAKREFRVRRAASLLATLRLTEDNLNQYLWRTVDRERSFQVTLADERATFRGRVPVLGVKVRANLGGRFTLVGPTTLRFVPDEFYLAELRAPRWILDKFLAKAFTVPLQVKNLPVEVRITDVRVEKGRLYLFAGQAGK